MNRSAAARLGVLLGAGMAFFLTACNGGGASNTNGSSNSALNMAGAWTLTTVSTQGHGTFSGTAAVSQSGQGLGVNGATTLTAPVGQIAVSQTGIALAGTITYSTRIATSFNFTGTLSGGNFTITGSTPCSPTATESTSITGTVTSNAMQGTYTKSGSPSCYYPGDVGTFSATKK